MSDENKLIEVIRKDGLVIIPSIYSTQQCKQFVLSCEDLKKQLCKKNFNIVHGEKNVEDDTTIFIEATNGDLIIKAHNGKLRMYGTDIEMHATGSSDSSKGNIRMTANENIELNAKKIQGNAKNMLKMVSPGDVILAGNSAMKIYGSVLKLVDDSCRIKNSQNNLQRNVMNNL